MITQYSHQQITLSDREKEYACFTMQRKLSMQAVWIRV